MRNLVLPIMLIASGIAFAQPTTPGVWEDAQGDAVIRRTDPGNNAPLPTNFVPIDLLKVTVEGWAPTLPAVDLYSGEAIESNANFVRIQAVFDGLVNPPGTLGFNGLPYAPHQFGDRPVTGFIDLDIDNEVNSGGEFMPIARNRYLANVARFGVAPVSSRADRMVRTSFDFDGNFHSGPEFERSGTEFSLSLCGCFAPTINVIAGNTNTLFEADERWLVNGRFFERFEAFQPLSGFFGGTAPGLFNPLTALLFEHDSTSDQTTITLVFPMTNLGAALAAGQPEQPLDFDVSNHTSMDEAVDDLIFGADFATGDLYSLTQDWRSDDINAYRTPSDWMVTALVGTAPLVAQSSSFYIWTDTGFYETHADLSADGYINADDEAALQDYINDTDGTSEDADLTVNGQVEVFDFATNFHFFDLNYDGIVSPDDWTLPICTADLNNDSNLNFFDVSIFLTEYAAQTSVADFNDDGVINFFDVSAFLTAFTLGCS